MSDLISVIVPVYNAEKYLDKCIQSILGQTYPNIELLLIDDGSTDSSGSICDRYLAGDTRVRVFHKSNEGISAARNLGLDNAKGEWIAFVDSDDWIDADMYEDMYNAAIRNQADMVCCDLWIEYKNSRIIQSYDNRYDNHKLMYDCLEPIIEVYFVMWNKLVSRKLYDDNNIRAIIGANMWEDVELMTKIRYFSKSLYVVNIPYYHYNKTSDSSVTISSKIINSANGQVERVRHIEQFFIDQGEYERYKHFISLLKYSSKYILFNDYPHQWRRVFPEAKSSLYRLRRVFSKYEIIKFYLVQTFGDFGFYLYKMWHKIKNV